jgi:hypothetical protein
MRITKDARRTGVVAAAAAALLLGAMAVGDVGAAPPYPNPLDVQKQWREVRARYPLVAAQYLELSAVVAVTQWELPCELQSLVNTSACRRKQDPECSPSPEPPPPPPLSAVPAAYRPRRPAGLPGVPGGEDRLPGRLTA